MAERLTVLIAEDHQTVREGLKLIINSEEDMEVVGEAGNGREAIKMAEHMHPDLILMDISMPELNGLKATAKLKRIAPEIKILALTRHTDDAYLQELLRAGVNGYVLKQSASADLIKAVRTVAAGSCYLDVALTGNVFRRFGEKSSKLRGETRGDSITGRESETLRYIAFGYSNKEIAEKLGISVKTVEAHKAHSMKKLNLESRKDIVRFAILQGWMEEN
jgi:two-component system, NarL family, response regulator NreC